MFLVLCLHASLVVAQGRLESEYKLAIPNDQVDEVWNYLQHTFGQAAVDLGGIQLHGKSATEIFIDRYFDVEDGRFSEAEISLRHRKRFVDGQLIKQLIQLKTPHSEDKVIRKEIKFEADDNKQTTDAHARHAFLKHLKYADKERMAYHLSPYDVRPDELQAALKLKQKRQRIYLSDEAGESFATLTLDEVQHASFPFQTFAELELELNEIRYTEADDQGRTEMEKVNSEIKNRLFGKFPMLKVDQRSKYRKMRELVSTGWGQYIYGNVEWLFLGSITMTAFVLFVKDHRS